MTVHSIPSKIAVAIATLSLFVGYLLAGYWWILPVQLVVIFCWGFTKNNEKFNPASALLFVYILLAAIGISLNLSAVLMILACSTALASWDLIHFERSIAGDRVHKENASLANHHIRSLALAISVGMLLALIAFLINLQLPFWGIIVLVLMAMGSLLYAMRFIARETR